jgi:hypothetical protein
LFAHEPFSKLPRSPQLSFIHFPALEPTATCQICTSAPPPSPSSVSYWKTKKDGFLIYRS